MSAPVRNSHAGAHGRERSRRARRRRGTSPAATERSVHPLIRPTSTTCHGRAWTRETVSLRGESAKSPLLEVASLRNAAVVVNRLRPLAASGLEADPIRIRRAIRGRASPDDTRRRFRDNGPRPLERMKGKRGDAPRTMSCRRLAEQSSRSPCPHQRDPVFAGECIRCGAMAPRDPSDAQRRQRFTRRFCGGPPANRAGSVRPDPNRDSHADRLITEALATPLPPAGRFPWKFCC